MENTTLTKREKLVMDLLDNSEFVTRAMVQEFTGCSQTTAITTLANMVKKNLLVKTGNGVDTKYIKS